VILLAAPDESSLAAKKKQRHGALEKATSTPKNRVWNFEKAAPGRTCSDADLSSETATGSVQFSYESASGRAHYYTSDHLGSVREMTDSSGTIQARYDYDPYGRATLVSGSLGSDFQYAGYYEHATSGLNLTLFRAYDPNTAKWLSRDPLPNAERLQGPNLYEYVSNNPIDRIDPLGLAWYNDLGTALDNALGNATGTDPNAWQQSAAATADGATFGLTGIIDPTDFTIQPGNQYNQDASATLGIIGTSLVLGTRGLSGPPPPPDDDPPVTPTPPAMPDDMFPPIKSPPPGVTRPAPVPVPSVGPMPGSHSGGC
jgi:RHS repeat-associated protein